MLRCHLFSDATICFMFTLMLIFFAVTPPPPLFRDAIRFSIRHDIADFDAAVVTLAAVCLLLMPPPFSLMITLR